MLTSKAKSSCTSCSHLVTYFKAAGEEVCADCHEVISTVLCDEPDDVEEVVETYAPIFVYGTLKPGGSLAGVWEQMKDIVTYKQQELVWGTMYDLGAFPACTLECTDKGTNVISGYLLYCKDTKALNKLLPVLDDVEGVSSGLYRRAMVTTLRGNRCYIYTMSPTSLPDDAEVIESGVWELDI